MSLCALTDVKGYLGITNTNTDAVLTTLIGNASTMIESWCDRVFELNTYNETRNGNGGYRLFVAYGPMVSVSSVMVDGVAIPPAPALTASGYVSYGYVFDSDVIYIRGGIPYAGQPVFFNRGIQNVYLTYQAGYNRVPLDVNQACVELVALKFAKRDRIDMKNEVLAQQTLGFDMSDMPVQVKTALAPYRRWPAPS